MKKVLFVMNTMGRAGAERALCTLLAAMDEKEFEIDVMVLIPRGEMFLSLPSYVNIINDSYSTQSVYTKKARISMALQALYALLYRGYLFRHFQSVRESIRFQRKQGQIQFDKLAWHAIAHSAKKTAKEYDLAVSYIEGASVYYTAEFVKARRKAAFIHIDYQKAGYDKEFDNPYYAKMNQIFCVSGAVRDRFAEVFPALGDRLIVFHNLLPVQEIIRLAHAGEGFTDSFDGIRILTVGRLHSQKAYDIAIQAAAELIGRGRNIRWYVIGEGSERKKLSQLIRQHQMTEHFILLGSRANPYPYMKQCDLYVQGTRFEGLSVAAAEALLLKKYIAASDVTGNTEQIIHEQNGLIFPLSPVPMADAVERLLTDEELRSRIDRELAGADAAKQEIPAQFYQLLD